MQSVVQKAMQNIYLPICISLHLHEIPLKPYEKNITMGAFRENKLVTAGIRDVTLGAF